MKYATVAPVILAAIVSAGLSFPNRVYAADCDCAPESTIPPGPVMGTWTLEGSPYCVTGDIIVQGLIIDPGVTVCVDGPYTIDVAFGLDAIGTIFDPITFTAKVDSVPWKGISFENVAPGSELRFCIIEKSDNSGLRLINSVPAIEHCTFRDNTKIGVGGGIEANLTGVGDLILEECNILNNKSTSHGGGIYVDIVGGALNLIDCEVAFNVANPNTNTGSYSGGGIYVSGSSFLNNCYIHNNILRACAGTNQTRDSRGGGIWSSGEAAFENCAISENLAITSNCGSFATRRAFGGGVFVSAGSMLMQNCLVVCNDLAAANSQIAGGVYITSAADSVSIVNSTIASNDREGLEDNSGTAVVCNSILFWNNQGGNQIGAAPDTVKYSCIQEIPVYPGEGNIFFGPGFLAGVCEPEDYELALGSPCVDAGDPDPVYNDVCFPPSLDTVRNDMGCYGGPLACDGMRPDRVTSVVLPGFESPIAVQLLPNVPNPFSKSTEIRYSLERPTPLKLNIYSVTGRLVRTLRDGIESEGAHSTQWDGHDRTGTRVGAGVYFYRLETPAGAITRKAIKLQ